MTNLIKYQVGSRDIQIKYGITLIVFRRRLIISDYLIVFIGFLSLF